ncbi:MAG: tRNA epoxyqueuosine(34) reductase QueG [Tistlia sp.]|uniref:tRNA epoxyqueuosine(34) reductase QueG n=1 Tax=Tistlia sp. TaxID=3057121 RepID=UPI0034A384F6
MSDLKAAIRDRALAEGFDAVGFAPAATGAAAKAAFRAFLDQGLYGDMGWLAETAERRSDPRSLWPEARSVVVLGQNYGPEGDPLALLAEPERANVSVYARNRDYHDTVKKRLKRVARWLVAEAPCQVKVFVDTAPVLEKPLAQAGGLGWQGKHSNLLSRDWGNWLFLGEIFTDLELPPDAPEVDHCGSCRRCLDACPTAAFPAPYRLDATRCISYLTIEHKGPIPREFRVAIGNRIYGCDDCLAVCPWNKFAAATAEAAFQPRAALQAPLLAELAALDDAGFRAFFSGSPIKRIGRNRFLRNVLIAIGNSAEPALLASLRPHLEDPAALVRGAAAWAFRRLATPEAAAAEAARALARETEPAVRAEWTEPLEP